MKFITVVPVEEQVCVIRPGMQFRYRVNIFLLAHVSGISEVDRRYCLIDIHSGNRWREPSSIEDIAHQLNINNFQLVQEPS